MAKLNKNPIKQNDLIEYLDSYSDFSFELKVLNFLLNKEFTCDHGGIYTDPDTKKKRAFDIRATKDFGHSILRLAIECKNLRENYPLLISTVPRLPEESFHEIIFSVDPDKISLQEKNEFPQTIIRSRKVRLTDKLTLYKTDNPVGKECSQVGRSPSREFITGDQEVYSKWTQALSSADDLISKAHSDGENSDSGMAMSLVFPVLVIPDNRLWITEYDANGKRIKDPYQAKRCSYFVNLSYYNGIPMEDEITISHLEIVTMRGLIEFIDEISGAEKKLDETFPLKYVLEKVIKIRIHRKGE